MTILLDFRCGIKREVPLESVKPFGAQTFNTNVMYVKLYTMGIGSTVVPFFFFFFFKAYITNFVDPNPPGHCAVRHLKAKAVIFFFCFYPIKYTL